MKDKGSDALLKQLRKLPRVGYIRRGDGQSIGWDLHFARERKLDDGGRQIVLATDRPISAWEAMNRPRSMDYDFTLADIRFDGDGKGVGKLSVAAKIRVDDKTGAIEIEDFGSEPVRLTEVTSTRENRSSRRERAWPAESLHAERRAYGGDSADRPARGNAAVRLSQPRAARRTMTLSGYHRAFKSRHATLSSSSVAFSQNPGARARVHHYASSGGIDPSLNA